MPEYRLEDPTKDLTLHFRPKGPKGEREAITWDKDNLVNDVPTTEVHRLAGWLDMGLLVKGGALTEDEPEDPDEPFDFKAWIKDWEPEDGLPDALNSKTELTNLLKDQLIEMAEALEIDLVKEVEGKDKDKTKDDLAEDILAEFEGEP